MTPQAIQLVVSRCLHLTVVDFCGEKHVDFVCKNITPNIEKVSLSSTNVSNDDIKTLVRRCNKIKELDISHTAINVDVVAEEIILHLSITLEKLCLPIITNPARFSLFKFGSMPRLRHIWSQVMYGMEKLVDLWEKQFPNVVLSSNSLPSFCPIITHPNIAKSMAMEERIWEIPCEGIELSDIQEADSNENKIHDSISDTREISSPRTFIHQRLRDLTFGTAE